jgi:hypothetical protein
MTYASRSGCSSWRRRGRSWPAPTACSRASRWTWTWKRASASARAIDLAERLGANAALVYALNNAGMIRLMRGEKRGRAQLERSLALAVQEDLATDAGRAFINLASCLGLASRWMDAMDVIVSGIEYSREHGLEAWVKCLLGIRAEAELALGHWDAAAETAGAILAAPRDQILAPRLDALKVLALVRARRGDPEYRRLLDEARQLVQDCGDLEALAPVANARAEAAWLEGRPEAIAEETAAAFTLAERVGDSVYAGELAVWRRRGGLITAVPSRALEQHRRLLTGDWAPPPRGSVSRSPTSTTFKATAPEQAPWVSPVWPSPRQRSRTGWSRWVVP